MFARGKLVAATTGQGTPLRARARLSSLALGAVAVLALTAYACPSALANQPTCPNNSITSNFNGTPIPGGDIIWFNSVVKASGASHGGTIEFHNVKITFTAGGKNYEQDVTDSRITYSTTATKASGTFNESLALWEITVPASFGDNVFLSGVKFHVPAGGLPGGANPVTWTGDFTTTGGISLSWQWGAAVYSHFGEHFGELGVKFTHSTSLDEFHNGDQAGTPENFKSFVTGGARGGGGSNFTGSYSATGHCQGVPSPPPPTIFLGYTSGGRHPVPWKGEVARFEGGEISDAGAIRIDAPSSGTTTVSGASVKIGTCTYQPWPGLNVSLSANQKLVLTETAPGAPAGCGGIGADNFDTSESFQFVPNPNPCVNDHLIPEIKLTINGSAETLFDNGQILNTLGVDADDCGANESVEFHEWQKIA